MLSNLFLQRISLNPERSPAHWDAFPFSLPVVRSLHKEPLRIEAPVTVFVGENGSGKSTLLEAVAVALGFNAEGGSRDMRFATRSTHTALHEVLRLSRGIRRPRGGFFLRAESLYNVASEIERLDEEPGGRGLLGAYGGRSLHKQSHGEAFLALLEHRFAPEGLYLLDEPEAALSPQRQLAALSRIHDLVREGSQFLIATHSPILMAYPGATLLQLDVDGIRPVAYEDTEHFRVMHDFLANPKRMLRVLLDRD
ncbi:AAA family ATPase [Inhella sp.]|uniref:AAA family ATPase n=1 Tax=Inhella sp. TaxID=1921806 RepID=UPI0035B06834